MQAVVAVGTAAAGVALCAGVFAIVKCSRGGDMSLNFFRKWFELLTSSRPKSRAKKRADTPTESKASDDDVIFVPTEEATAGQSNAACSRRSATAPPAKPPASDRIESGGLKERRPLRSPRTSGGDVAAANRSTSPRSPALRLPPAQPADHLERLQYESKLKDAAALHLPQTNNVDQLLDDVRSKLRVEGRDFVVRPVEGVEEFPVLPPEANDLCAEVWREGQDPHEVFVEEFNQRITRRDLQTLRTTEWLNDEVINFYFSLLVERSKCSTEYSSVYAFSTYFYAALTNPQRKARIHRWTKGVNIFDFDLLLMPLHLGAHWCLAVVDVENRELRFFDSMQTNGKKHLNALRDYLREESAEKHASRYSVDDYQLLSAEKCPKQMNGYDCGMFTCRFAEYVSRRAPFNFAQRHMAYFRKRTVFEIVNKELL